MGKAKRAHHQDDAVEGWWARRKGAFASYALSPRAVVQSSQLLGIHLEASRPIGGLYAPRGLGGDLSDFAASIVLATRDDFAGNKSRLRELAIGPEVSIRENRQFIDY